MTSLLPNSRRPDVSFYPDGRIDITARIAKMLELQSGDVIDVAAHYGEYLLYVRLRASECVGRHEAQVYPTKKGKRPSHNFRAYSHSLNQELLKVVYGKSSMAARLPAGTPVTFGIYGVAVPLITQNPL